MTGTENAGVAKKKVYYHSRHAVLTGVCLMSKNVCNQTNLLDKRIMFNVGEDSDIVSHAW